ncbi:adhesion G-protein coupled receptor G4 [Dasypus novemcinctus]|uniref:adhesion G-protein coupled receptor G4 n=1 Tax=Dasypus novemcinctus TaxID=9361 RepID=UPI00265EEF42|nr:adhesion G-protein coupled receptor G4 [Dasypus novemcinctus]
MKEHIIYQRLYGVMLMSSFIFLSDALSLKGKKLDFYGRDDTYASLTNTIPELSRFTACVDLVFTDDNSSDWMAFSYITSNTSLGLAGNHQQLILYNLGKTLLIPYRLAPFRWHTICLIWDGVKGKLELFLNKDRLLVMMDKPQNMTPNGTLVLGHLLQNGDGQIKSVVPSFTGSLYYFQLWDHILENKEFSKCLRGNVVSWEEDVWLINKIIPTVDWRLRCFVSENITIQGTSTTLSQQIDLTTPYQSTGLTPENTVYSSTVVSESMPVFAPDDTTMSYSDTTPPPLETMTATKNFKTSIAETATLAAGILSTSAAITQPTESTSLSTSTNSMKTTRSPSSESTRTTKMIEAIATETFHPTAATLGFTKNSVVSKTSVTGSQSAIIKTMSLVSSIETTSMPMTSRPQHKSTATGALPISTADQVFLASTAAGTAPWSTVEQASATATHIGTALAVPSESVLISTTAIPVESVLPINQTASTLATTDVPIEFTVHSMMLPTRHIETTPVLESAETELTSTNFQDVSSPRMEEAIATSVPKEASSMALSFRTSSPFTGAQSAQTVIDAETTFTSLNVGITFAPTVAETVLSSTNTQPVYTQNRPTPSENMLSLISTRSVSTSKSSGSVLTSLTDEVSHLFSTDKTTWTSRPDQTLLKSIYTSTRLAFIPNKNFTSAFHGSTSKTEHSSTTTNSITPQEVSVKNEAATTADAVNTSSARYTTLSNLASPWFANFSTVSGTASVPKPPEFKLTTSLLKTTTVAVNELPSTPGETVVPPADMKSTLANIKPNFSTEESPSEITQTETNGTIAFGETTTSVPKSVTTQIFSATVTRKETTSHYLKGKSTTAVTLEISPFSTMLEATDEPAQMVTTSATISPFPDRENTSNTLDDKTATTEKRGNWFSTKSVKTTHKSSYNGTTEIINPTHTYTAHWTSENPVEGNSATSPTSGNTQTFPKPPSVSTTKILGTIFTTTPTESTTMSLSSGILLPQSKSTNFPATPVSVTHTFSLPVNTSAVTSMVVSDEAKVTIPEPSTVAMALSPSVLSDVSTPSSSTVTTLSVTMTGQNASTTMPPHRDSVLPTSETTVISVRMTPSAVPSLTKTPVPSLRPLTPMATKAENTFPPTSSDTVTPSTHILTCSTSLPGNIPVVSSTYVTSTVSTPVVTKPASQAAEATALDTSTRAFSFPYSLSGGADVFSLSTDTTETSFVDETRPSHTTANELITSVDVPISQSSTRLVNTPPLPTPLVTGTSTLSSDKQQMTTSLGNISRTMEVTETPPSRDSVSYSLGTSSLEMTNTGLPETTKSSSHRTRSPSGILVGTPPEENSVSSLPSGNTQTTAISTSNNTVGLHVSKMSTSLGKTALFSQTLTNTTFLSHEKESMSTLSTYTPRSVEQITEALSSIPETTFSPILSTTQQLSQGDEATTVGVLPGITLSSLSTVNSSRETVLTNTYSRTVVTESVLSPTLSNNLHTSLNIQFSPSLTSIKSTPGTTKSVKATTSFSSNTGKMASLSENTSFTAKLTKSATSLNTPVSYTPRIPSIATLPSLTSSLFSLYSTETQFFTSKTSSPLTSHMVELPILGTGITSSDNQSLLMTSWNTPTAEDSQFPISTAAHVPTPNKMETTTLHLVPGSLPTFQLSQTSLASGSIMTMPSTPTSGSLPTFELSDSPSLSTSSRVIPTTLADIKHTFEKTTTSETPVTMLPLSLSATTSGSIISKATTSPRLTWISSSLPSVSPLATVSKIPQVITPFTVDETKSTFLTSDISTHPFINFTTLPFATISTIPSKTTPTPKMTDIITGLQTSLPVSIKITDDSIYISTFPGVSSRTTVTANSKTVSQHPTLSRMNTSPLTTDHTLSIGSISMPHPTITSAWSRIPGASASLTVLSKSTMHSFPNINTTTSTTNGASFPLKSTGGTHPSTANMSSVIFSSFGTTWLESTSSFIPIETSTSPVSKTTVSFYNTEMSFSVFDEEPRIPIVRVIKEFAKNWLNSIFQDSEFSLANLAIQIKSRDTSEEETMDRTILEQREGPGMATISHVPYSCVCQVIIKANSSLASTELISRIKSKIHGNLTHGNFTQDQLMILVKSEHVEVKKLEPGKCNVEVTVSKYKGTYEWLLTNPMETAQTKCVKNKDGNAIRNCSIHIGTGKSQWEKPKFKQCKLLQGLPDKIVDLANITINDENADDVAEHILNLINESPPLDEEETKILVSKVSDISQCDEISMNLTQIILQIVNAILEKQNNSASDLYEVRNEILRIIERAGHKMEFFGRTANLTTARLALAVLRVDYMFEGLAFSIGSYEEGTDPEVHLGNVPLGKVLASIYLPKSLKERIPLDYLQTILFNFFGQTSLFKSQNVTKALTTYVVSASISNMSIQNLADPVVITLQHIEGNQNYDQVHCAFWDFEKNNGLGGWNSSGCKVKETNINYTICQCDHLTHFGVLLDLSRSAVDAVNERILALITYTGCGISSVFLGIAIVTYIAFHKLRKDYPSKILINLCTALLMLNLIFLINSWLSSFQKVGLCITAAVALHYFLLVSFTWMGLEAVHMYFALVKVFNIYIPNYILKFCLVGWGIPAVMVAIVLSVKRDLYGSVNPSTPFCWIKDDSIFYISVAAYFCLIFLMNLSMFCTVLAQLNSMKFQSQKTRRKMILHDLKGTTSLTFLLGLTWGFAFFAWGPVRILFLYLFAIFNTLQGFLIFVFHCVMKESVREQWQVHLCWRRFQPDNSSDGGSRCGLNVGYKQERLNKTFEHKLLTPSLTSTATSSTFKSLGSAQGTSSDISFPNDDFDEDPYYFSPLGCDVVPNCVRSILPVEIKMNSIHQQRFLQ